MSLKYKYIELLSLRFKIYTFISNFNSTSKKITTYTRSEINRIKNKKIFIRIQLFKKFNIEHLKITIMKKLTFLLSFMCFASMLMAQATTNYDANGLYTGTTVTGTFSADFTDLTALGNSNATLREVKGVASTYCTQEVRTPATGTASMALTAKPTSNATGDLCYIYLPTLSSIGTFSMEAGYVNYFKPNIQRYDVSTSTWVDVIKDNSSFFLGATWKLISRDLNINAPTQLRYKHGASTSYIAFKSITITQYISTGLNSTEKGNKQVFVNADNQITIIAPAKSVYAIYSATGQLIESGATTSNLQASNLKLQTGVYLVRVNNESTKVFIK